MRTACRCAAFFDPNAFAAFIRAGTTTDFRTQECAQFRLCLSLSYPHQNHRLLSIIGHARERLSPERRPAFALQDLAFSGRLDQ
jgi:hypothetical protein